MGILRSDSFTACSDDGIFIKLDSFGCDIHSYERREWQTMKWKIQESTFNYIKLLIRTAGKCGKECLRRPGVYN